jgi:hypothetical protein
MYEGRDSRRAAGPLVASFPTQLLVLEPRPGHVGFVVDKVALGQIFSEYFGLLCPSFHPLLYIHHHSSPGAGTVGQIVADISSGPALAPPHETKRTKLTIELISFYTMTFLYTEILR